MMTEPEMRAVILDAKETLLAQQKEIVALHSRALTLELQASVMLEGLKFIACRSGTDAAVARDVIKKATGASV